MKSINDWDIILYPEGIWKFTHQAHIDGELDFIIGNGEVRLIKEYTEDWVYVKNNLFYMHVDIVRGDPSLYK